MSRLFILPPTSMMRPASMTSATATWGEGARVKIIGVQWGWTTSMRRWRQGGEDDDGERCSY